MAKNKSLIPNLLNPKIWGSIFISALIAFAVLTIITCKLIGTVSDEVKVLENDKLHFTSTLSATEIQTKLATIEATLLSLKSISEEYGSHNDLTNLFQNMVEGIDAVENLIIFDKSGQSVFKALALKDINISDRSYFNFHKKSPVNASYISEPIIGRLHLNKVFTLTRPLIDNTGHFNGIYLASIRPGFFDSINKDIEASNFKLQVTSKRTGAIYYGSLLPKKTLVKTFSLPNTPFEFKLYTDEDKSSLFSYIKQRMQNMQTLLLIWGWFSVLLIFFSLYLLRKQNKISQDYKHLSNYDPLTQVYNRRAFMMTLKREIHRAKRYDKNLALIMLDIDHFKSVNDQYGHLSGDQVLIQLSQLLDSSIRVSDTFFRIGGEEFAILLPETTLEGAIKAANNYRQIVENNAFQTEAFIGVCTASFGVSVLSEIPQERNLNQAELLIKNADKALYLAKESRNTVKPEMGHSSMSDK